MKKTNIDSPFYRAMGKLGDLLLLNVLWLVCCVPVVTAGASTLALFAVTGKLAAGEDYTVREDFFKALRRDFKQSTAVWLVLLAVGFAAFWGLQAADRQSTVYAGLLTMASFLLGVGVCCCGSWGLALLARFSYPRAMLALVDGARMTLANLLPSLGILACLLWAPLLGRFAAEWFVYLAPFMLLLGGALSAWGMAALMRPAFAKLEKARAPEAPTDPLEDDPSQN